MGMTIDLAIKVLKRMIKKGIAYDDGYAFEPLSQDEEKACSIAIDTMNRHQMMQAEYENRLKADMVAMMRELKEQLREMHEDLFETEHFDEAYGVSDSMDVIQQKINDLSGKDGNIGEEKQNEKSY